MNEGMINLYEKFFEGNEVYYKNNMLLVKSHEVLFGYKFRPSGAYTKYVVNNNWLFNIFKIVRPYIEVHFGPDGKEKYEKKYHLGYWVIRSDEFSIKAMYSNNGKLISITHGLKWKNGISIKRSKRDKRHLKKVISFGDRLEGGTMFVLGCLINFKFGISRVK